MTPLRSSLTALVFLSLAASLSAQSITDFGETIEVRIINVDVVVTDRAGHPVPGLTQNDFEIFQSGKKQGITNFYEFHENPAQVAPVRPALDPAADAMADVPPRLRGRKWIVFLDELSLDPFRRNTFLQSLRTFLRKEMTPRDTAMLVSWNHSLQVVCPFTGDQAVFDQAISRISNSVTSPGGQLALRRDTQQRLQDLSVAFSRHGNKATYSDALAEVRAYADQVNGDLLRTVSAINSVISSVGGTEGRKILILGSQSLPTIPGIEMFHFLDAVKDKFLGGNLHQPVAEGMSYESSGPIQSIATNANAHDVTLYAVDPGGFALQGSGIEDRGTADIDFASGERMAQRISVSNDRDALKAIAEATGGKALISSNQLDGIFSTIHDDLGSYYSLGYSGSGARQDRERRVRVKVRNPAYSVRTRASLVEKSLESEVREALVSNLMFPSVRNDLGVLVKKGVAARGRTERDLILPLQVLIPRDHLTLLPAGETLNGSFTVYVAFERRNGAISKVVRQPQQVRMPAASSYSHVGITLPTTIDDQTERISIGVVDDLSKAIGYATVNIGAPVHIR